MSAWFLDSELSTCLDSKLISCKPVVCYLGIFVDCHLNWNDHCKYVAVKATKSLNVLHHYSFNCPSAVKSATYKCIVQRIMEYTCPVYFLHTAKNIRKSSDDGVKVAPIHQHYYYFSICQVHDIFHNRHSISLPNYFHLSTVHPLNI